MNDRPIDGAIAQSNNLSGDRPSEGMSALMRWWFGLFHHWDFIYLNVSDESPDWKTNNRHPLNAQTLYDRWKRNDQIIGVRFATKRGGKTYYFALDIDCRSPYHPLNDETAFSGLIGALELIGLCRYICVRSSESGGIHLYFPLPDSVLCTKLSLAVHRTLEQNGFMIAKGKLELFPNLRSSPHVGYQGLRLPLQTGSYVLGDDWQPLHNDLERLIVTWQKVSSCQDMELLGKAIAHHIAKAKHTSKDTEEWKTRLETTIREGWTDYGQTDRIVKELCQYARVFVGCGWDEVERWVLKTVLSLPGYRQYCRHQPKIRKRVGDWVRTNRKSKKYYPIGSKQKGRVKTAPNNEEKSVDARQRIEQAIASILNELGAWPDGVMPRLKLIQERSSCNSNTIYKHQELWHPKFDEKVCVNPCGAKVLVVLDDAKNESSDIEVCVNHCPERITAIAKDSLNHSENTESQSNRGFTHASLQSVSSSEGSKEKENIHELTQITVGSYVRWKTNPMETCIFRVTNINVSNRQIIAKRLHKYLTFAQVYLSINDIELVDPPNTDQTA